MKTPATPYRPLLLMLGAVAVVAVVSWNAESRSQATAGAAIEPTATPSVASAPAPEAVAHVAASDAAPVAETTVGAFEAGMKAYLDPEGGLTHVPPQSEVQPLANAPVRPEQGLLKLRATLGVYANLRPVKPHPVGAKHSPLKPRLLRGVDILFVRELTGGSYFGEKRREGDTAFDACRYSVPEIERATRRAGALARARRGKLTHVDKANVLETSRLWRSTVTRIVREEFPEVELEHVLVDAMAMHLVRSPARFDVIVTENLFGDILTDEASVLAGSIGMLPSASLGAASGRRGGRRFGLYEPIHGSAPDIAGKGIANPIALLLSAAMMLDHVGHQDKGRRIRDALDHVLVKDNVRTGDLGGKANTKEFTRAIISRL